MDGLPELTLEELALRVLAAIVLGGLVGFEREFSDQPAGFRTHILVSLGAMLFTVVGAYGVSEFAADDINFDPTRVAAQVVSGIGFLGAGAILREGLNVKGLTTAAALWVTAAIGVAVGLGYWSGAVLTTIGAVTALYGLKKLGRIVFPKLKRGYHRFVVHLDPGADLAQLASTIEAHQGHVHSMRIDSDESGERHVVADIRLPTATGDQLGAALHALPGVTGVEWRD
ncbi:MAG: MgtC/SapB family protein [Actinomycetota bacterium]